MKTFLKYTLLTLLIVLGIVLMLADVFALPTYLVFLILKLTGQVAWAWINVCVPAIIWVISAVLTNVVRAFAEAYKETVMGI